MKDIYILILGIIIGAVICIGASHVIQPPTLIFEWNQSLVDANSKLVAERNDLKDQLELDVLNSPHTYTNCIFTEPVNISTMGRISISECYFTIRKSNRAMNVI
jgi:hypothetical protein